VTGDGGALVIPPTDALRTASASTTTGCIGSETRRALRRTPHLLVGLDPTDRESIERFQADHELEADGVIGPQTQAVLATLQQRQSPIGRDEEPDDEDELQLERELHDVVDALRRRGPLSQRELADEVNARLWRPGRLRYVLRSGRDAGVLQRTGRNRWAAA
jgi:hypothetical protein